MLSYSGVESAKVFLKEVVVGTEVLDSIADGGEFGGAVGDTGECFFEAFEGFVRREPVFGFEEGDEGTELGAQPLGAAVEELIILGNEVGDGAGVILAPMFIQEVVEEDVDDDAGEAEALGGEQGFGGAKGGMVVGEAVDAAMHHDAVDDGGGESLEEGGGGSFLKVAQNIADARGVVGSGKGEVGEEVHFLERRGLPNKL